MKTRLGFVTNSSSSSFIIACRPKLTPELIHEAVVGNIPRTSLLYDFAVNIAGVLYGNTYHEDLDTYDVEFIKDYIPDYEDLKARGFRFYRGSLDRCGVVNDFLHSVSIDYRDDNLLIYKLAGCW